MTLDTLTGRLIPNSFLHGSTDQVRRIQLSVIIAIATAPLCIITALVFLLVLGNVPGAVVMFLGAGFLIWSVFYFRTKGSLPILVNSIILVDLVMHTVDCFTTGAIKSPLLTAYIIMPLLAIMLLGDKRAALWWTILGVISIAILGIVSAAGIELPVLYPADREVLVRTTLSILLVSVVMIFVLLMQGGLDRTLRLLDEKNLELDRSLSRSDELLLNILPSPIAERLKRGERDLADYFPNITVLFADIVDFTAISQGMSPTLVVNRLNTIFKEFDAMAGRYGLEKIKTIGDCYMVVGGLPEPCEDHVEKVAEMAFDIQQRLAHLSLDGEQPLQMRIGVHTGEAVAGVIGTAKFIYDLWGDTVNTASRMEALGEPGKIQCTEAVFEKLDGRYCFEYRGEIDVRGKGRVPSYFLTGRN